MKTEIAYTTDRLTRVTYRNFWYTVETKRLGRWVAEFSMRDRDAAISYIVRS